jgi:beta-RFAP synthase
MRVEVEAHARLHLGFLDPSGEGGRRFGGIGLAIGRPRHLLTIEPAPGLIVEGVDAERVEQVAARFHDRLDLPQRARIVVREAIPAHVGLGSGTQLALALAAGLSRLHRIDLPPAELCVLMGRGRRSGVGYHLFQQGGFVVEGGHLSDGLHAAAKAPPLLLRHEFPEAWRIVLAIPQASQKISGEAEEEAFRRLRPAPVEEVDRIAHLVLMRLLPALVERDLPQFGAALAEIQERVGSCFAPVQEGPFHPGGALLARRLKEAGGCGVGQSSWGPAVYALAADQAEEDRLRAVVRGVDPGATLLSVRGVNRGASVETAAAPRRRAAAPPGSRGRSPRRSDRRSHPD